MFVITIMFIFRKVACLCEIYVTVKINYIKVFHAENLYL